MYDLGFISGLALIIFFLLMMSRKSKTKVNHKRFEQRNIPLSERDFD